jgi:hypothetical protein
MTKKISECINHYIQKHIDDEEKIISLANFIEDFFITMPEEHTGISDTFHAKIDEFTDELETEMIIEAVSNLKHRDGTVSGAKWSLEEAKTVAKQYDIKNKIEAAGKKFDCHIFWFALNYVYAVHYSLNRTINGYVELAIDEYTNKNICFDNIIRKIFDEI